MKKQSQISAGLMRATIRTKQILLFVLLICFTGSKLFSQQQIQIILNVKTFKSGTAISCNGAADGEIDASLIHGTPPFSFRWSSGSTSQNLTSVGPGAYYLIVTDSLGTADTSNTVTLYEPDVLSVHLKADKYFGSMYNISSNGGNNGAIEACVHGGNTPYNFVWSNDSTLEKIENLTAATYSVTVTDNNGCAVTASKTLIQPDAIQLTSISSPTHNGGFNVSCSVDDDAPIRATGTFLRANTFTPSSPSGVTSPPAPSGSNTGSLNASKQDGLIHVTTSGGIPPYLYIALQDSVTVVYSEIDKKGLTGDTANTNIRDIKNLSAGNYLVGVVDQSGAFAVAQITLTQPSTLSMYLTTVDSSQRILSTVTGGVTPYTYGWNSGATDTALIHPGIGQYNLMLSDANGCREYDETTLGRASGDSWQINGNPADSNSFMGTYNNMPLILKTNSGERMRISENGNVGIGTNAPTEKIDVNGNINLSGGLIFGNDGQLRSAHIHGQPVTFGFGYGSMLPLPPCYTPAVPIINTVSTTGLFQSSGISSGSPQMFMGYDGTNSIVESSGAALHIDDNCGQDVYVCAGSGGGNTYISAGTNGADVHLATNGSNGNVIMATGGGNVGVGNSNPVSKLDIQINPSTNIANNPTFSLSNSSNRLFMEPKLIGGYYNWLTANNDAGIFWTDGGANSVNNQHSGLVIAPTGPGNYGIRIDASGSVGIGVSVPQARLHVNNPIGYPATVGLWVNNGFILPDGPPAFPLDGDGIVSEISVATQKAFVAMLGNDETGVENFVVYGDGQVLARDVRVTLDPLVHHPDFVFEKKYKLMSLAELEKYLKQNSHLPNIPSASDVKENKGISLGEMSEKQLEKIEELTLYIIELNKRIETLEQQIQKK